MPELPEVETTLRGLKPYLIGQKITGLSIRHFKLRWQILADLPERLVNKTIQQVTRRGKYLLFSINGGTLILHLGMSGRLSILKEPLHPQKHDHIDIHFANNHYLRFTDPRRFGALLWTEDDPHEHFLLKKMGIEPLTKEFNAHYLWEQAKGRKIPVKSFVMDSKVVAGVGNIYAAESLFLAGIRPQKAAGKLKLAEWLRLADAIKLVLKNAIKKGGTTLKDFSSPSGNKGYFSIELKVYGREGDACYVCKTKLRKARIGQRSSVYCPHCQK